MTVVATTTDSSSNDDSDDASFPLDEYDSDDNYNDDVYSDNGRFDNNSGRSREDRAQDCKVAKVRKDREQRLRSALIQDIYIRVKHERERRKYYTTPAPLRHQTSSLKSTPQRVSTNSEKAPPTFHGSTSVKPRVDKKIFPSFLCFPIGF